jgi:hypothetical protein
VLGLDNIDIIITAPIPPILGDVNGDGCVNTDDLIAVILGWGPCPKPPPPPFCLADVDLSGTVDADDLVLVILNWGGSGCDR